MTAMFGATFGLLALVMTSQCLGQPYQLDDAPVTAPRWLPLTVIALLAIGAFAIGIMYPEDMALFVNA